MKRRPLKSAKRDMGYGAYYDDEFGTWFYMPPPTISERFRAWWYFKRQDFGAWLAVRWPHVFNRDGDLF